MSIKLIIEVFNQPSTLNGSGVKQPKTNPFLPLFGHIWAFL